MVRPSRTASRVDAALRRQDGQPLDQVLQLAHVARPGVLLQRLQAGIRAASRRAAVAPVVLVHEEACQQRDVAAAFAQGRDGDAHHVEPVPQVFAELALVHHLLQVAVGGRDHPHVHFLGPRRAHRPHFALLQKAQQLELEVQFDIADFVQEYGAAIGRFENAHAVAVRPGVGAADRRRTTRFRAAKARCEPQSTGTNGCCARGLKRWTMRATSSLPVPVSPSMSTVASVGATREASCRSPPWRRSCRSFRFRAVPRRIGFVLLARGGTPRRA